MKKAEVSTENCIKKLNALKQLVRHELEGKPGEYSPGSDKVEVENCLSKIFHKGNLRSNAVYTAVVSDGANFLVSCPGQIPCLGWEKEGFDSVKTKLLEVLQKRDLNDFDTLLYSLYENKNGVIVQLIRDKRNVVSKERNQENTKKWNKFVRTTQLDGAYKIDLVTFLKEKFLKIEDLAIIKDVKNFNIDVLVYEGKQDFNHREHVESKGVNELIRNSSQYTTEFKVGLTTVMTYSKKHWGYKPGCCAYCTAEFKVLHASTKKTILIPGAYEVNFPKDYDSLPNRFSLYGNEKMQISFFEELVSVVRNKFTNKPDSDNALLKLDNILNGKATEEEQVEGDGLCDHEGKSYWFQYTYKAMQNILKLCLDNCNKSTEGVGVLKELVVFDGSEESAMSSAKLIIDGLSTSKAPLIFAIINLYHKHWVGLIVDRSGDNIDIRYVDPERNSVPESLKVKLLDKICEQYPTVDVEFSELETEIQKYNNCGPEVIENFIWYLTGERLPQAEAVKYHSKLVEKALLSTAESEYEEDILGISAKSKTADIVDISEFATAAVGDAVDIPVDMQLAC